MNGGPVLRSRVARRITTAVRLLLGGVFIYSCAAKIAHPEAFAAILTNYQIVPQFLIGPTAVVFPWIEAVCGTALVIGCFDRGAALLVSLMTAIFIGITLSNGYRGLNIACGCFSLATAAPTNIVPHILIDLLIMAAGVWVLLFSAPLRAGSSR
jgi:uncharacterized membrane protein YphA (DoxX/SURF4 family)